MSAYTLSFRSFLHEQGLRWEEWRRSPSRVRDLIHTLYRKEAWKRLPEQLSFCTKQKGRFSEGAFYWLQFEKTGGNVECVSSEGSSVVFQKATGRACDGSIASTALIVYVDDKGWVTR